MIGFREDGVFPQAAHGAGGRMRERERERERGRARAREKRGRLAIGHPDANGIFAFSCWPTVRELQRRTGNGLVLCLASGMVS
eukprot:SAG22_NODE_1017_length_6016_cov_40.662667_4_plen_83_part_00